MPGGGQLHLARYGRDYEILLDGEQLMSSWASRSEEALATLSCAALVHLPKRVLIGGLGMGFTLRSALAVLSSATAVVVAELVPGVVDWARGPLAHLHGTSLDDPRVELEVCDVHDVIAERPGSFDIIMLDVDNGPDGLVSAANERLYCGWGLQSAHAALRPGGILAVWSAEPDPAFSRMLRVARFRTREIRIDGGLTVAPHTLWLATRRG